MRETRLIDGEYQITLAEMLKATRHKDAIFQTAMPTDAHLPKEEWSEDMGRCRGGASLSFSAVVDAEVSF